VRWRGQRESDQVEDRRGSPVGRGGGIAIGGGGLLLVFAVAILTGRDPLQLLQMISGPAQVSVDGDSEGRRGTPEDELGRFAATVLASTEDVWRQQFAKTGGKYELPTLVLFSDEVSSACGFSAAAVGPFYCPADRKVYIDLAFFSDLEKRFAAPGDFAQAYVIAHEVGHHVQNLLGISDKVQAARQRQSREEANAMSVRLELQADCLAGVWAHGANRDAHLLEDGDVEEGLAAAAAIGDDRLQREAQGYTVPETWTHGSSEMRARWLRRGLERGDASACDTFARGAP
jgi:predicted metalloprotease